MVNKIIKKITNIVLAFAVVFSLTGMPNLFTFLGVGPSVAHAAFNKQINYQGKLMDSSNNPVADGTYHMTFRFYTSLVSATTTNIWEEDRSTILGNRITVTDGLFSVMLGSSTVLTGINFNQPLYLGVEVGGSGGSPSWDGEMTPRKILGAVPAAFVADTLDGLDSTEFVRTNATSTIATSSSQTILTVNQTGSGDILNLQDSGVTVFSVRDGGNVGIGTTSPYAKLSVVGEVVGANFTATTTGINTFPNVLSTNATTTSFGLNSETWTDLTGTGLQNIAGVLTLNATGDWTGVFDGQEGSYYLDRANHTGTQSASTITGGTFGTGNFIFPSGTLTSLGSTTLQNFTFTNATGTSATTTNFFATNFRVTNFNLAGAGANMLLSTDASGNVVSTSTPTAAAYRATSTTATSTFAGGLSVAGTNGLTVLQNGNVGIRTTAPGGLLDLQTGSGIALRFGADVNATTRTDATRKFARIAMPHYLTIEEDVLLFVTDSESNYTNVNIGGGSTQYNAATAINFITAENNTTLLGSTRMTIDSGGNVGIGTTSPYAKLSVVGEVVAANFTATTTGINTFPNLAFTNATGTNATTTNFFSTTASSSKLFTGNLQGANLTTCNSGSFLQWSAGLFGCATDNTASSTLLTDNNRFTGGNVFYSSTTIGNGTQVGGLTVFGGATTTGSAYFVGNVGIGTAATSSKLAVSGDIAVFGSSGIPSIFVGNYPGGGRLRIGYNQSTGEGFLNAYDEASTFFKDFTYDAQNIIFKTTALAGQGTGVERMRVTSSGNVGIGTTSPYAKLSVVGEVVGANFTATTTANNTFPNLIFTSATGTNATTTSFAISSVTGSLLKTNGSGSVVGAVAGTDYLATAVTAIGPAGQTADGPTVTFATTSDTNIGLTITGSGDTLTYTSTWTGTLADARVADNLTISGGTINNTPIGASTPSTGVFTNATTTSFGLNSETWTDLTGTGLQNIAGVLTLNATGDWTGVFDGQEGSYYLDRANHTGSQSASTITGGTFGTGNYIFPSGTLTSLGSTTLQNFTFTNATGTSATTTNLNIGSFFTGAGLTDCANAADKLLWTGGVFSCGSDAGAGGGITSLNGQTGSAQTFATSTSGIDFTITSGSNIHTFNLPFASASANGKLSSTDWTNFNNKVSSTSIDTSLELANLITDETGSGALVFGTLPTLTGFISNASSTVTGGLTVDRSTTTSATTTSFAISSVTGSLLKTNGSGSVVGAVAGTDYLATAVTAIGPAGQTADGPTVTFATTSDTNIGLTITGSGDTLTYTSTWTGTLADARVADNLTISGGTINNTPIGASTPSTGVFTNATTTSFGLNSETWTDLTGTGLQNIAGVLTLNATGDWTGVFDGQEGSYYLDRANHTGSQSASTITGGTFGTGNYIFPSGTLTSLGSTTLQNFTALNSTTTNATTTRFAISGISSSLLKTNGSGSVIPAIVGTDYENPLTFSTGLTRAVNNITCDTANASTFGCLTSANWTNFNNKVSSTSIDTSLELANLITDETGSGALVFGTLPTLTGFISNASSTIGNGTQFGGLTISGGATTTGSAYFANKIGIGTQSPAQTLDIVGTGRLSSTLTLSNVTSCSGSQALQTNGSGDIACGNITVSGASTGGGWTTDSVGNVTLATTTDAVGIGATTTPYAKLSVISSSVASTTLALRPASSATANIIDIYNTSGVLGSVFTAGHRLGIGTINPSVALDVNGQGNFINILATGSTTLQNFTALNSTTTSATTTSFAISSVTGSLLKTNGSGSVVGAVAGTDYLATAVTAIGPAGQTADGPTVTFATTSDTNIGLTITGSGDTLTYTSTWTGTLADARVADNLTISGGTINNTPIGASTPSTGVFTNATTTSFGLNSETWTDLTGTGLQNIAGVLTLNATGDWTGVFDGQEGSYYLDRANHTGSQSASTITGGTFGTGNFIFPSGTLNALGSTTLQNFTFTNATGTSATTTNLFSTTASSTNLFFTTARGGNTTLSGLLTSSNILSVGSTTLQNFTFTNATGTSATTTNFFSTTASSSKLFTGNLQGANLTTCNSGSFLQWSAGLFGCATDSTASSTLLVDNNTFSGANIFNNITRSTTTSATTTSFAISSITGSLLKTNGIGSVVGAVAGTDYENPLTFSTGLTRAVNNITCDTANASTFGCLTSANWTNFNNKISSSSLSGASVISYTAGTGVITTTPGTFASGGDYIFPSGTLNALGSTTLQNFTFTNATGTSATTTSLFSTTASSTNLFFTIGSGGNLTSTGLVTATNFLANASSTFQNMTFTNATGTSATTTNFFSTTASSTNLFFTTARGGNTTLSGLLTSSNILSVGSTTLQNFTFTNATGTSATTTNFFSTTASSSKLFTGNLQGANLTTCNSGSFLQWSAGLFGCATDSTASSTLLVDNNTFSGANIFNNITRSTTTSATTTSFAISSITGSLLKTNGIGSVVGAVAGTDYENPLTFSTGLTRAVNNITCDTANASTFGCLTSANWTNFNNKISSSSLSGASVISYTAGTGVITTTPGTFVSGGDYIFPSGTLNALGSTTLQNFTFTNATGTSATTTSLFSTTASSTNLFFTIGSGGNLTSTGLVTATNFLANASSTFQNMTFTNATGTSATTTNFFSTTASSTNLFFTTARGGNTTLSGLLTSSNILSVGSTTLQNFTFTNATGTSATTTNFFSTTASSSKLFTGNLQGANLTTCNSGSFLQWSAGLFGCATDSTASSTLLVDNNTFSGANIFNNITRSTTTSATTTSFAISSITGSLLKTNGIGSVVGAVAGTDYENPLTFSTGLTRAVNNITCDTANASTFGCLTSANWTNFNNKISSSSLSGASVISYTAGTGVITTTPGTFASGGDYIFPSGTLNALGSTTLQNFTFTNATGTSATTTNLFSTSGTFTNLFATNFAISGIGANMVITTDGSGNLVSSSTPQVTAIVATSTTATSTFAGVLSVGSTTPASNSLFSVGTSSQLLFVDKNTGNVGIKTTNSTALLNIASPVGSNATPTIYNPTSGAGIILRGLSGASTGQLRVVPNTGAWADSILTTYFQMTNTSNNSASFMGGTAGNDVALSRLQFNSLLTSFTDGIFGSTPVPTHLVELIGSVTASKGILKIRGATSQSGNYLDVNTVSGTGGDIFTIRSSGNVGIGTTSPYAKLSVVGEIVGSYFTGTTTATSTFGGNLAINGTGTTTSVGGFNISNGCFARNGTCFGQPGTVFPRWSDIVAPNANLTLQMDVNTSVFNWTTGSGSNNLLSLTSDSGANGTGSLFNVQTGGGGSTISPLRVRVGSTESIFVSSAGNVGIGTTDVTYKFQPTGQSANIDLTNLVSDDTPLVLKNAENAGDVITGIGFANFSSSLQAFIAAQFIDAGATDGGHLVFSTRVTGGSAPAERMRITSAGNVGIGTTSPYAKLSVVGEIVGSYFTGTSTATSSFFNLTTTGTATSTFNRGINLNGGCFAVNGACVGGSGSSASTTLLADNNTFSGANIFNNITRSTTTSATTTSFAISSVTGSLLKTNGSGSVVGAVAGTDYLATAVTAIGPAGQTADGPTVTFATTSDTNIGLTITGSGDTLTYTSTWTGTLADARVADNLTISGGTINNTPIGASTPSTGVFTNATTTSFGLNSETWTDLTGTGLQNIAGVLTLNATGDWTGVFDGQEGSYYLDRANHTGSQSASTITGGTFGTGNYIFPSGTLNALGSTTLQNFTFTNATGTSATTTNLFSTTASTTNLFVSTGTCTGSNALNVVSGKVTCGVISGGTAASSTLLADNNSFSGNNTFTGENLFLASTTIGAGTPTTGLTVSGNSTTTGNAYFAGNVGIGTTSPTSNLEIKGAVGIPNVLSFFRSTGGTLFTLSNASGETRSYAGSGNDTTTQYQWLTSGSSVIMNIDAVNQRVGIATTSPYARLSVVGGTSGTVIGVDALSGYTGNILELKVASTTKFSIDQGGNFIGANSTTTNATTTNLFSTSAVFTSATSTNWFSTTASTSNLFAANIQGANLSACTGAGQALRWTGGLFSCGTISGIASSTLLADNNTFSGNNTFSSLITGAISGNAGSATVLQTARTINGVSFNGGANITITAASSTILTDSNYWTGGNFFFASTTIGNGTATGGLTVNGGATTTGTAYFAGNVGIGTTSPFAKLSVFAGATDTYNLTLFAIGSSTAAYGTSTLFSVLANGFVGIGTTSPNNLLDIYSTSKAAIGFSGAPDDTYKWTIGMDVSNSGKFIIASSTVLGTNNRFSIDGDGRLQVGTGAGSGSPGLLVLDTKNTSGDPTGVNGAIYYNSNSGVFRCYENSAWVNCTGVGTSTVPIMNGTFIPDTGGNSWMEPYSITATNDVFNHMVAIASSTTVKTGFYGRFHVPENFSNGAMVTIYWTTPATSGNVVWDFDYRAIGGDDAESLDQATFQESVTATDAAPGAIDRRNQVSIKLTDSNFAKGDTVEFYLARDGADASDTLAKDAIIQDVIFEYKK